MFKRTLQEVVGEYAGDQASVEIKDLRRILGDMR
jgi:hypothetical protein